MRKSAIFSLLISFMLFVPLTALFTADLACAEGSEQFFSQGQAPSDPQDQLKSQQLAVRDFMAQAITQAVGKFLSPTQVGTQYSDIQKNILTQPSKYVDSYQVFSEAQTGGLYQVTGQVTVTMDVLRKDLEEFGFPVGEGKKKSTPAAASVQAQEDDGPDDDIDPPEMYDPSESPAVPAAMTQQEPQPPASRGLSVTKKEILWVVPEKWEQEWVLPNDRRDARFLFAKNIGKALDDYDYSIQLPQPGSVKMDISGNIPSSQVIGLAEGLGIQEAVLGTVYYRQDRNSKQTFLETELRLIRIGSGKSEFQIRKTQSIEELSNQDGALELASRIAPEIDKLLGGTGQIDRKTAASTSSQSVRAGNDSTESAETAGQWTIDLPSVQYPYWKELERLLREQFKNMQITSLEMGQAEGTVKLNGVDGSYISRMNGTALPSGAMIRINSYSTETKTIKLSFIQPGKS